MPKKEKVKTEPKPIAKPVHAESHAGSGQGSLMRQIILGGQDGLVNVLGIVLGVAGATNDPRLIIIAGFAATAAESISMGAVAYTSSKAEIEHYYAELKQENHEIDEFPEIEREEIKVIYMRKGFRGKDLEMIVDRVCSDRQMWIDVMIDEELGLKGKDKINPLSEAFVVGFASVIGSLVPIIPFLLLQNAVIPSLVLSLVVLFIAGAYKGKITVGNWLKSGIEMAVIGFGAALVGYAIGSYLGVNI